MNQFHPSVHGNFHEISRGSSKIRNLMSSSCGFIDVLLRFFEGFDEVLASFVTFFDLLYILFEIGKVYVIANV